MKIAVITVISIASVFVIAGGVVMYESKTSNEQSSASIKDNTISEPTLMKASEKARQSHFNSNNEEPDPKSSTVSNNSPTQHTNVFAEKKRQNQTQIPQVRNNDQSNQGLPQTKQNNQDRSNLNVDTNTTQAKLANSNNRVTSTVPISNTILPQSIQIPQIQRSTPVSSVPQVDQTLLHLQKEHVLSSNNATQAQENQADTSTNTQTQQQSPIQNVPLSPATTSAPSNRQPLPQQFGFTTSIVDPTPFVRQPAPQQSQSSPFDTTSEQMSPLAPSSTKPLQQRSTNNNGTNATRTNLQNKTGSKQTQSHTPQIIIYPSKESHTDLMIRKLTDAYKEYKKNLPEFERDSKTPYGSLDLKRTKLLLLMEKSFDSTNKVPNKKVILADGLGTDSGIKCLYQLVFDKKDSRNSILLSTVSIICCMVYSFKQDTLEELTKKEANKRNIKTLKIGVSTLKGPQSDPNISPSLLICNEYTNLCFMFSFLQILSNLEAFKSGIKDLEQTNNLGKALNSILTPLEIEKGSISTNKKVVIDKKNMDVLFKELNEAGKGFLGEEWLKKDEQNSADNLWQALLHTQINGQEIIQRYCSIDVDIHKDSARTALPNCQTISMSQFYLRLGQKYHLFEALEYYFHDYNAFDDSQSIEFRSLPAVLTINFEKQIFFNVKDVKNSYECLSAIFEPRFYLGATQKKKHKSFYLFKGAYIYKPISNDNITYTSSGHYYVIVLYGDQYYKCDTTIITPIKPEVAAQEISLYGLTWFYEKTQNHA